MAYQRNRRGNDTAFGLSQVASKEERERAKAIAALEMMKRLEAERRAEMRSYIVGTCIIYSKDSRMAEEIARHQRSSWAELGFRQSKMKQCTPEH